MSTTTTSPLRLGCSESLPSTFRSHLAERGFVSQYDACLGVWTEEGFADVAKRLTEKIREGLAPQDAMRAFSANAAEVKPDSQGRILLPQRLREFAGLERDVVVIGAIDRIEIWDSNRWGAASARADESLVRAVTALGI